MMGGGEEDVGGLCHGAQTPSATAMSPHSQHDLLNRAGQCCHVIALWYSFNFPMI